MNAASPASILQNAPREGTGPTGHIVVTSVPPRIRARWTPALLLKLLAIPAAAVGLAILYWFNPAQNGFYPRCGLYQATGLLCPGCGSLRALHQLLHGNLAAAFRLNALLVLSLPFLTWLAGVFTLRKLQHRPADLIVRPVWFWTGFAILLLFGIGRNLR